MIRKLSVTKKINPCKITYMNTPGERIRSTRLTKKISQEKLADFIGVSRVAVTLWESNENIPKGEHLLKCAQILGVTPTWLLGMKNNNEQSNGFIKTKQIPLITWHHLLQGGKNFLSNLNKEGLQMIIVPANVGDNTFAVKLVGDSMVSPHGMVSFSPNEIIVIDPNKPYKSGSFVMAKNETLNECHFSQYVSDGGITYLKPLNPQYPLLKAENYEIIGTCCYKIAEIE